MMRRIPLLQLAFVWILTGAASLVTNATYHEMLITVAFTGTAINLLVWSVRMINSLVRIAKNVPLITTSVKLRNDTGAHVINTGMMALGLGLNLLITVLGGDLIVSAILTWAPFALVWAILTGRKFWRRATGQNQPPKKP